MYAHLFCSLGPLTTGGSAVQVEQRESFGNVTLQAGRVTTAIVRIGCLESIQIVNE